MKSHSFRLPDDLFARFRAAAKADRRSLTAATEIAMEMYIEEIEQRQGKRLAA